VFYYLYRVLLIAPVLMTHLYPPMITGDSGEDAVELLCTESVTENVTLGTYTFEWFKDGTLIDLSYHHTFKVQYANIYIFM